MSNKIPIRIFSEDVTCRYTVIRFWIETNKQFQFSGYPQILRNNIHNLYYI